MQSDRAVRLYPIVDSAACHARARDPRIVAQACLQGGARLVQLRVKEGSSAAFLSLAESMVQQAVAFEAAVIVNDRADVARMCGARGVHVGQDDLPAAAVRQIFPDAVIGLSTHTELQVDEAIASDADYVAVGPIFDTDTKATGYTARGLQLVRYAAGRGKPVVAIGGITIDTAPQVIDAGASAVAVISGLLTGDIADQVRRYLRALA